MRLSWSPDGRRLLVCDRGALRIVAQDGAVIKELDPRTVVLGAAPRDGDPGRRALAPFLDGHWLRDGRIAALDIFALPVSFTMHGEPYSAPPPPPNPWQVDGGVMSATGDEYLSVSGQQIHVYGSDQRLRWELSPHAIDNAVVRFAELARDRLAIACEWRQRTGAARHGWIALDRTRPPSSETIWDAPMLANGAGKIDTFAFDRAGQRLLVVTHRGAAVVRLAGGDIAIEDGEVPRCAALDERGMRVVYGFARTELRIDYLSPKAKGPAIVEVIDTQQIEASFAPVAVALDPDGTRIACVAEDGRVEIVPVP